MATLFYNLALLLGFLPAEANKITCIAKHESGFKSDARSPKNSNNTYDYGILQINDIWLKGSWGKCKGLNPYNPADALKCARVIIDKQGWTAWVAYQKHRNECDNYIIPKLREISK